MKLILIESVEDLGLPGDIVDVKPGYARNFLLPHRKALKATEQNVAELEHQKRIADARRRALINDLRTRCEALNGSRYVFTERVTESGRLYGSVGARQIVEAIAAEHGPIQAGWLKLSEPIKQPGLYEVELRLAPELSATINVEVRGEGVVAEEPAGAEGKDVASDAEAPESDAAEADSIDPAESAAADPDEPEVE